MPYFQLKLKGTAEDEVTKITVSENENSVKQLSQSFLLSVTLQEVLQTAISLEFQEAAR